MLARPPKRKGHGDPAHPPDYVPGKPRLNIETRGGAIRLDLGCGDRRPEPKEQWGDNWIGIDISPDCGADYVLDLTRYPWPLADESVDEIFTSHFLEHLDGQTRIPFMEECWRVLKTGSKMTVVVPYWSSMRSIQDPFHKWPPICEMSFLYFNRGWIEQNKLTHYGIEADFDFSYGYVMHPDLRSRNDEFQLACARDHINAIMDLSVTLSKRPMPEKGWGIAMAK